MKKLYLVSIFLLAAPLYAAYTPSQFNVFGIDFTRTRRNEAYSTYKADKNEMVLVPKDPREYEVPTSQIKNEAQSSSCGTSLMEKDFEEEPLHKSRMLKCNEKVYAKACDTNHFHLIHAEGDIYIKTAYRQPILSSLQELCATPFFAKPVIADINQKASTAGVLFFKGKEYTRMQAIDDLFIFGNGKNKRLVVDTRPQDIKTRQRKYPLCQNTDITQTDCIIKYCRNNDFLVQKKNAFSKPEVSLHRFTPNGDITFRWLNRESVEDLSKYHKSLCKLDIL